MNNIFELLPLAALAMIGLVGLGRAAMLYGRGVQVIVIDKRRTLAEQAFDLIVVLALVFWVYLICDYAWPPGPGWLPALMQVQLPLGTPIRWFGACLLVAGVAIYATAVLQMGEAWRMGIDREGRPRDATASRTNGPDAPPAGAAKLVTTGIYSWSRNPIYLAFDLVVDGAFVVHGNVMLLTMALVMTVLLHLQVIREEHFLQGHYGPEFLDYQRRVGQYGPWNLWLKQKGPL